MRRSLLIAAAIGALLAAIGAAFVEAAPHFAGPCESAGPDRCGRPNPALHLQPLHLVIVAGFGAVALAVIYLVGDYVSAKIVGDR